MPDLDQIKQGEQASARAARGRSLKPPTIGDAVKAGGFLAGRPEDIIEQLKAVEKRYPGIDRVVVRHATRYAARRPVGRPGPVRERGYAGLPLCQDRRRRRIKRSRRLTRPGRAFNKGWEWCEATLATSALAPAAAAARA